MKYMKETPRLIVKFINADTEAVLFEINDRTWMNIGDVFTDWYVDAVMKTEMKDRKMPTNLMILVVGEYKLK
jgi:hypothetical protein